MNMKKYIFSLLCLISPFVLFGQTGSGTSADPFSGIISTNVTWPSGIVYVGGNITINAALTINTGTTVAFANSNSIITVANGGSLTANGTEANSIIFNADHDGNGIFGETLGNNSRETWRHIIIETGATVTFNYCRFENAYFLSTNNNIDAYGGALLVQSQNVNITNCTFKNNENRWGGAIFVHNNGNVNIDRCSFEDNTAHTYASAVYFYQSGTGLISNSIFNNILHAVYAITIHSYNTISIVNCSFSYSSTSLGAIDINFINLQPNYPTSVNITNCSLWGSNHYAIRYTDYNANVIITGDKAINITNCAYQGSSIIAPYTDNHANADNRVEININNSVQLNRNNTASNGPNFNDPANGDYSLSPQSPLFDAGTNTASAGSYDMAGNPRTVGTIDIGAYELQLSLWRTDATSNDGTSAANWKGGVPDGTHDVLIPDGATNYPTAGSLDLTIAQGDALTLEPDAEATFGSITNNGTLTLESDNTGHSASLIMNSYSGNGTTNIELSLTGGSASSGYRWHYISSPVTSLNANLFTGTTLNLAQYIESTGDWVAYDGYNYTTGNMGSPTFNSLTPSEGYNYYYSSDQAFVISGSLNTNAEYTQTLTNVNTGWNLFGNPYTSGLSWDEIVEANSNIMPNINAGVYFTHDNVQYSYINGVNQGVSSTLPDENATPTDNGIIPPMQGFFVRYYGDTEGSFTIPASARAHDAPALYKGDGSDIPLIRLLLEDSEKKYDDAVVRFDEKAVAGLDRNFDGLKAFKKDENYLISTFYGDTEYSINGMPFPQEDGSFEIPVWLNIPTAGSFKISVSQLQNLDNYLFILTDSLTGEPVELTGDSCLEFNTNATGEIKGRFVLTVTPRSLPPDPGEEEVPPQEEPEEPVTPEPGEEEPVTPVPGEEENPETPGDTNEDQPDDPSEGVVTRVENNYTGINEFSIYQSYGNINIVPKNSAWDGKIARVTLINLAGQRVKSNQIGLQTDIESPVEAPNSRGMYLVEIVADGRRYVGKIIIK